MGQRMKRLGKILGYSLLGLFVLVAIAITFTMGWQPFIDANPAHSRRGRSHLRRQDWRGVNTWPMLC